MKIIVRREMIKKIFLSEKRSLREFNMKNALIIITKTITSMIPTVQESNFENAFINDMTIQGPIKWNTNNKFPVFESSEKYLPYHIKVERSTK